MPRASVALFRLLLLACLLAMLVAPSFVVPSLLELPLIATSPNDALSPIDPGLDPKLEAERRDTAPGSFGLSIPLGLFIGCAVGVVMLVKAKRRKAAAWLLIPASVCLMWSSAETALRLTQDVWALHVKIRSNCYHSNPRGYFIKSAMQDHPESAAWCVDALEPVWRSCERGYSSTGLRGLNVLALGDSFTDGVGVFRRDAWPQVLARKLNENAKAAPAYVANCGMAGIHAGQIASRYETYQAQHHPDIVIYAYTLNDIAPLAKAAGTGGRAEVSFQFEDRVMYLSQLATRPLLGPLIRQSALVRVFAERMAVKHVADATEAMYRDAYENPQDPALLDTIDTIATLADSAKSRKQHFLLVIWPLIYHLQEYPFKIAHQRLTDALTERGIAVLDLLPIFEGKDDRSLQVHPTDFHPNEIAHAEAAKAIQGELERRGWIGEQVVK